MDYWNRLILFSAVGVGIGLLLGETFGNHVFWVVLSAAIGLASETSLRTMKNVQGPPNPLTGEPMDNAKREVGPSLKKPPPPHF